MLVLDQIDTRADALEQDILWISTSHLALLEVGGHPQSRYERAYYSLQEDVVITLPVTMENLSVRAVKTQLPLSRLPPQFGG